MADLPIRMVEANAVTVKPSPGSVYVMLRGRLADGSIKHQVHAELCPTSAIDLAEQLLDCAAVAMRHDTPKLDIDRSKSAI